MPIEIIECDFHPQNSSQEPRTLAARWPHGGRTVAARWPDGNAEQPISAARKGRKKPFANRIREIFI